VVESIKEENRKIDMPIKSPRIVKIKFGDLLPTEENPNRMKEGKFNALVKAIEELGYDQMIKCWYNEEKKKYEIVKGNHRYWALKVLGTKPEDLVDCVVGDYENRDEMLRDMVRDNTVKGQIDPIKFTELWNKLAKKYGREMVIEMFDFLSENEIKRLVKEARKGLPTEEMKRKLDEARKDIKTIDDLSVVLNKIFTEYGDTLKYNFMIFDYLKGGKVVYIRCSKENWQKIEEMASYCKEHQIDINEVIKIDYEQRDNG